jgi:type 2 lantibiotic biosynthesis protein LanM
MGIALFFAALFYKNGDPRWRTCALNCLSDLRRQIQGDQVMQLILCYGIGGFSGVGGLIYGLVTISTMLQEPLLLSEAKHLALAIQEEHIHEDTSYDLIGGSAGLLLSLLKLYKQTIDPTFLKLAILCGDHLCSSAIKTEHGVAWMQPKGSILLGFSHGTAGVAYALLRLASYTQQPSHIETARLAMEYERVLFDEEKQNWPDFREKTRSFMVSWCHGATGIGFGRLASMALFADKKIKEEVAIALKTNENALFDGLVPTLCCGTLGRIELLFEAAHLLNNSEMKQRASDTLPALIAHLKQKSRSEFFVPGLMKGAAGVGYTLLRLQDKTHSLPQVLLLN